MAREDICRVSPLSKSKRNRKSYRRIGGRPTKSGVRPLEKGGGGGCRQSTSAPTVGTTCSNRASVDVDLFSFPLFLLFFFFLFFLFLFFLFLFFLFLFFSFSFLSFSFLFFFSFLLFLLFFCSFFFSCFLVFPFFSFPPFFSCIF